MYRSILISIAVVSFLVTHAQKVNPAIIKDVPEAYAWDIVYQSFKAHNKKLGNYNKQTQTAKSIYYRYTSMLIDNRAKYQVSYTNGNIEIKFVERQYLSQEGWVVNLLPLSKRTKKKYIYPIATTIRELSISILSNTPPVALFQVYPTSGGTAIDYKFNALESYDNQDPSTTLEIRWDWQNDGIWDKPWSTEKIVEHNFSVEGKFTIKMEIKDSQGTTNTLTQQVIVKNYPPCPNQPIVWYMGQSYNTILIGEQCWFKENLNAGTMIEGYQPMSDNGIIEKYCFDNDPNNCIIYGGLYQWDEITQYNKGSKTGICPEGWQIPNEASFEALIANSGGWEEAGDKLKEAGLFHWPPPESSNTNENGFTALSGGISEDDGTFNQLNLSAYFASGKHIESTDEYLVSITNPDNSQTQEISYQKDTAWNLVLPATGTTAEYNKISTHNGVSLRCMKSFTTHPLTKKYKKRYPNACFKVDPPWRTGTTETIFKFNGDCSTDEKDPTAKLKVRWNFTYSKYDPWYDTPWRRDKKKEHQFKVSGCYNVKMEVRNTQRRKDDTIVKVCVYPPAKDINPPFPCFEIEPKRGALIQTFEFDAECSHDYEDPNSLLRFCWDWNNDWKWDTDTSSKNIQKRLKFKEEGKHIVGMEVFDTDGHSNITTREVYVGFPTACFTVEPDPETGSTEIFFRFDASCSFDTEDPPSSLRVKWDFENDGKYETDWSTKRTVGYKYFQPGIYTVKLLVMDTKGLKDSCYLDVYVESPIACFETVPDMGRVNQFIVVDASCSNVTGVPDAVLEFRWDWDDNGIYDTDWSTNKSAKVKYDLGGFYKIKLKVRTKAGNLDSTIRTVCIQDYVCPTIENLQLREVIENDKGNTYLFYSKFFDTDGPCPQLSVHWDYPEDEKGQDQDHYYLGCHGFPRPYWTSETDFEITLNVTDGHGCTSTRTLLVNYNPDGNVSSDTTTDPPQTNCPKKEYLIYFPFKDKQFVDSINAIAARGYKLIDGNVIAYFFEKEQNSSAIYPIKILETWGKISIEELNKLEKDKWVVVSSWLFTYLIKDESAPNYEYILGSELTNDNWRDDYLPGSSNIQDLNDLYGDKGWELVDLLGDNSIFRRIIGSDIKYKYSSLILTPDDKQQNYKRVQELGAAGWQYCVFPILHQKGDFKPTPIILKQRVDMGDAFSFQFVITDNPGEDLSDYRKIEGSPEKERQMVEAWDPLLWHLNNFGRAGWKFEMSVPADEDSYGKDKMMLVFQVSASCR